MYSDAPDDTDELELVVGKTVELVEYDDDGWWLCRDPVRGKQGFAPSNFLNPEPPAASSSSSAGAAPVQGTSYSKMSKAEKAEKAKARADAKADKAKAKVDSGQTGVDGKRKGAAATSSSSSTTSSSSSSS